MTPDDVAAYRAEWPAETWPEIHALCDALEAAWAERDEKAEWITDLNAEAESLRERAERAEAAVAQLTFDYQRDPRTAALDRVRALCGVQHADWGMSVATRVVTVAEIRAAIEGTAGDGPAETPAAPDDCDHEMYLGHSEPAGRCEHGVRVREAVVVDPVEARRRWRAEHPVVKDAPEIEKPAP